MENSLQGGMKNRGAGHGYSHFSEGKQCLWEGFATLFIPEAYSSSGQWGKGGSLMKKRIIEKIFFLSYFFDI